MGKVIRGGDAELSLPGESGDGRAISFSRLGAKAARIPGHPTQGSLAQGKGVCVCARMHMRTLGSVRARLWETGWWEANNCGVLSLES